MTGNKYWFYPNREGTPTTEQQNTIEKLQRLAFQDINKKETHGRAKSWVPEANVTPAVRKRLNIFLLLLFCVSGTKRELLHTKGGVALPSSKSIYM